VEQYILTIDQSTSGTKGLLVNLQGRITAKYWQAHQQIYPQPGWVEHDPEEIYGSVLAVVEKLIQESGINPDSIAGVSISNQRETAVVWNKVTGAPVYNAVVWQCMRGDQICAEIKAAGFAEEVRRRTGLVIDPYFSASKIQWILEHVEDAGENRDQLLFGTIDSWLIWKMTNGEVHATDYSNASRTMLYNIQELMWDPFLFDLFRIPMAMAPEVRSSNAVFGVTDLGGLLPGPVPVCGVIGDSQAALFGQGCTTSGSAKVTYGTGSSIVLNIGRKYQLAPAGIVTSLAWGIDGTVDYIFEGNAHCTGKTIDWIVNTLGLIPDAASSDAAARSVADNGGVYMVPAFVGLGAPYWNSDVQAAIFGLTFNATKAHIVRAGLESIAYQIYDVLSCMQGSDGLQYVKADGGASQNSFLMQFQADILQLPVATLPYGELSALGASYMGGLGLGFWQSLDEIAALQADPKLYQPRMPLDERCRMLAGWKAAVDKLISGGNQGE
jgi:glycerol kinase